MVIVLMSLPRDVAQCTTLKLYCRNFRKSCGRFWAAPRGSGRNPREIIFLRCHDLDRHDVANTEAVPIARDKDEAVDVRRIGRTAADPDVFLAFDRLIENHVERPPNLLLVSCKG